jgi:DNA (cytosine-5)-methyltransferase 1
MGLERADFQVAWANDYESDKKALYEGHFRDAGHGVDRTFVLGDIAKVTGASLPQDASLAWASSPCTDLSLAGARARLAGSESGAFWHFARLLDDSGATAENIRSVTLFPRDLHRLQP